MLLAHVARVALPLQPFEVGKGCQRCLAQQARQGPRLVRPRQQHCVAAQNHGLVARLVAVHPGENARVAAVSSAVGDARQQVGVRRSSGPRAPGALAGLCLHQRAGPLALALPPPSLSPWFPPTPASAPGSVSLRTLAPPPPPQPLFPKPRKGRVRFNF
uniref:Uncharacterized protein n=1 Tax=Vombatus ursinus TaxID=29139 RepID=A0A4X2M495_VOMUR